MNTQYHRLRPGQLQSPGHFRFLTRFILWASITLVSATVVVAQPGAALNFDGTDDYVSLPAGVYFSGNLTIEAWVYPRSIAAYSRVIDFGNGPDAQNVLLALSKESTGMPRLDIEGQVIESSQQLPLNQWSHIAATLNGTAATLYINGVVVGSGTISNPPTNMTRNNCYIGRSNYGSDAYADAVMDDIRIWNVARTANQIAEKKDCELKGNESGLVAYYTCNQGTASGANGSITTLTNAVSGGPVGTLTNFSLTSATSNFVAPGGAIKCISCNTYQTITTANGLGDNNVSKVVAVGNTVYAATNNGLSISTDGGQTFTINRTTANGLGSNIIYDLQVVGNAIYAGHQSGLAISTDGGQSFTNRSVETNVGRVYAVFALGNTVYVGKNANRFFRSTDGGLTFGNVQQIINPIVSGICTITDIYATGNTVYVTTSNGLFVSTNAGGSFSYKNIGALNQNTVFGQGSTIYVGTTAGLFISTDGGTNFVKRTTSDGLANNGVRGVYAVGSRVYVATDGGVSFSTDGGQTFKSHTADANGLGTVGIGAVAAQGERVYAGTSAGLSIPGFRIQTVLSGTSITLVSTTITLAPNSSATVIGPEPNDTYNWITGSTAQSIQVNTTGIYSLTTTGACPGSSSVSITVLQPTSGGTLGTIMPSGCPAKLNFSQTDVVVEITGPSGYIFKNSALSAKYAKIGIVRYDPTPLTISLVNITKSGVYTVKTFNAAGTLVSVVDYPILGGCN